MPTPPPRIKEYKRIFALPEKITPHPQVMDKLEVQEIAKTRPLVKTS